MNNTTSTSIRKMKIIPKLACLLGLCLSVVITAWKWNFFGIHTRNSSPGMNVQQLQRTQLLHNQGSSGKFSDEYDHIGIRSLPGNKKSCIKRTARTGLTTLFTALSLLYQDNLHLPSGTNVQPVYAMYTSPKEAPPFPSQGFQTKSGLKYFDLYKSENTRTPRYGEFVSFRYAMMYQPYGGTLQLIDSTDIGRPKSDNLYLNTHGNNRLIRGLDEAFHTMTVGSRRRVIIPPNLAYVEPGKGPIPLIPDGRKKLNKVLDEVAANKGDLIFDLELVSIIRNENDFGYYDDQAVSLEEIQNSMEQMKKSKESFDKIREEMSSRITSKGEDSVKTAK